jgi:hypothetical protein
MREREMSGKRVAGVLVTALAVGALWSGTAVASDPAKKKAPDPNKRICKMIIPTGSRMGDRVCKTAAEWQHDADEAQRIESQRRDASINH